MSVIRATIIGSGEQDSGPDGPLRGRYALFWIGVGLAAFLWLLEALLHVLVFQRLSIPQALFYPPLHELWMRLVSTGLVVAFGVIANALWIRHREAAATIRAMLAAMPDMMLRIGRDGTFVDYWLATDFRPAVPPSEFLG